MPGPPDPIPRPCQLLCCLQATVQKSREAAKSLTVPGMLLPEHDQPFWEEDLKGIEARGWGRAHLIPFQKPFISFRIATCRVQASGVGPRRLVTPAPLSQLITVIIFITSGNAFPPDLALLQGLYPASITLISLYYFSCLCLPASVRTPQSPTSTNTLPLVLPRGLWPSVILFQHKSKLLPKRPAAPIAHPSLPPLEATSIWRAIRMVGGVKQLAYMETLGKLSFLPWRNDLKKGDPSALRSWRRGTQAPQAVLQKGSGHELR